MSKVQKDSMSVPELKAKGIDFFPGAAQVGVGIQAKQITQVGASPYAIVFADHGLSDMADTLYTVNVNGETVADTHVDQSTIATTGFSVLGGANDEVLHIQIIGRLKNQLDANGSL